MRRKLDLLDREIAERCDATARERPSWPCGAACADCCRSLARVPELTLVEWERVRDAIETLEPGARAAIGDAVARRAALGQARPIVCPLLDEATNLCRVYDARPIACRTYGFYAERDGVLGCERIADVAAKDPDVLWGNHDRVMRAQEELGERRTLLEWLDAMREPKEA